MGDEHRGRAGHDLEIHGRLARAGVDHAEDLARHLRRQVGHRHRDLFVGAAGQVGHGLEKRGGIPAGEPDRAGRQHVGRDCYDRCTCGDLPGRGVNLDRAGVLDDLVDGQARPDRQPGCHARNQRAVARDDGPVGPGILVIPVTRGRNLVRVGARHVLQDAPDPGGPAPRAGQHLLDRDVAARRCGRFDRGEGRLCCGPGLLQLGRRGEPAALPDGKVLLALFLEIRRAQPVGPGYQRIDIARMQPVTAVIPRNGQGGRIGQGAAADTVGGLEHDKAQAGAGQFQPGPDSGGPGPYDDDVEFRHPSVLRYRCLKRNGGRNFRKFRGRKYVFSTPFSARKTAPAAPEKEKRRRHLCAAAFPFVPRCDWLTGPMRFLPARRWRRMPPARARPGRREPCGRPRRRPGSGR